MENYQLVPIKNLVDALEVRKIRNECRNFMTKNPSEINLLQQLLWYFRWYKPNNTKGEVTCYLFRSSGKNIGFGMTRSIENKIWITGGLKISQRGKGRGKYLFEKIIEQTPSNEVWLEVLESNLVAFNLYKNLGFKKMDQKELNGKKIFIMKLSK